MRARSAVGTGVGWVLFGCEPTLPLAKKDGGHVAKMRLLVKTWPAPAHRPPRPSGPNLSRMYGDGWEEMDWCA